MTGPFPQQKSAPGARQERQSEETISTRSGGPACARPAGNGVEPTRRELQRRDFADRGREVRPPRFGHRQPSVTEATLRCDKCKREMSGDEPAWRLWRSFTLCADCKPHAYFREPQPCTRCGRPVRDHDTTLGIVYCGTRCQELLLPPA